jgi:hypothetical protein
MLHAKASSLRELKDSLESYLSGAPPIRRPSITALVLPPKARRDESANFSRQLGDALRAMGTLEYGEVYALDDGAMPKYELRHLPETRFLFTACRMPRLVACESTSSRDCQNQRHREGDRKTIRSRWTVISWRLEPPESTGPSDASHCCASSRPS